MKKSFWSVAFLALFCDFCGSSYAYTVSGAETVPVAVSGNNETVTVNVQGSASLNVNTDTHSSAAITNSSFVNTSIDVTNPFGNSSDGIVATGSTAGAISFTGTSSLSSLSITGSAVSSEVAGATNGTVAITSSAVASTSISIGSNSVLSNSATGGNAIYVSGSTQTCRLLIAEPSLVTLFLGETLLQL